MAKRSLISQLPVVHQSKTLQQFFNATVDRVFQPGSTESINSFIGRKPSYYDEKKEFYKHEIDGKRQFYHLEPAMTTKVDGDYTDLFFYTDLVNQLRFQGALTEDENRLFETELYSWCPPVNIDKLHNYRNYYWMPYGPPTLIIHHGLIEEDGENINPHYGYHISDGIRRDYPLPAPIEGAVRDILVRVNGVEIPPYNVLDGNSDEPFDGMLVVDGSTTQQRVLDGNYDEGYAIVGDKVVFTGPWTNGDVIEIWTNANFAQNIIGQKDYLYPSRVYGEIRTIETRNGKKEEVIYGGTVAAQSLKILPGMRLRIIDNNGSNDYSVALNEDGEILLNEPISSGVPVADPQYITIERDAANSSSLSRSNSWYHKDIIVYQHPDYRPTVAQRPIIEYFGGARLFANSARRKLPDVNFLVESKKKISIGSSILEYSTAGFVPDNELRPMRFRALVLQPDTEIGIDGKEVCETPSSEYDCSGADDQQIFQGTLQLERTRWSDDSIEAFSDMSWDHNPWEMGYVVKSVEKADEPQHGDSVSLAGRERTFYFLDGQWYEQDWNVSDEPLFELYDQDNRPLSHYEGSNFRGSRLFSYKEGTQFDPVLGKNISKNRYGNFEFTDNISADHYTYVGGTIGGYKYYALDTSKGEKYLSNWLHSGKSQQEVVDGYYEIPKGLQSNPLNENITTVSINDWFKHFNEIIEENNWFLSSEYYHLNAGKHIVQHRSSLLPLMLLSSNASLDVQKAILFCEREYLRFRNRFKQVAEQRYLERDIVNHTETVQSILNQLRMAKTPTFPFHNNGFVGNNFIPPTGSYLGVCAVYQPEIFIENGVLLIRGHDGSILRGNTEVQVGNTMDTIEVHDVDMLVYQLEVMMYDSCNDRSKSSVRPIFDILEFVSAKYRSGDYSVEEFCQVARPIFERWVAQNGYDYRENTIYDIDDPFTWNYSGVTDKDGETIPGYWRGMYRYYYDTERPHTHPWEMLGYTKKPYFWDAHYSWTDTSKRHALIEAIEQGLINPITGETDSVFARPDFSNAIPVDMSGTLLNPVEAGIVRETFREEYLEKWGVDPTDQVYAVYHQSTYGGNWEFGDGAPVETMWFNSYAKSFVAAQLGFLLKPNRFVSSTWIGSNEKLTNDQWINERTGSRRHDSISPIHNERNGEVYNRVVGLQTWISDFLVSQGKNITTELGTRYRALGVNLAHKLGGFVDPESIKAFTDNAGLVPADDVNLALYRSPSIREEFYGGVIIEWTGEGWRVMGYDVVDPVFKILPVQSTGNRVRLSTGESEDFANDWHVDTYYQVGTLARHGSTVYRSKKTHTSGRVFEPEFWEAERTNNQQVTSVMWALEHEEAVERVPYGTVYRTQQEIADVLSGYQAYLESRGWVFDLYDNETNTIKDFKNSTLEFLQWAQTDWAVGTFIALSPCATSIKFTSQHGTVQNVEQLVNGVYSLLDRSGQAIPPSTVRVFRLDDEITISVEEGGIFGSRVFISEVEQALLFNNKTIFDDVIYDPKFGLRQSRIRLVCLLGKDWKGRLDAPGFVITDNKLVPSFERQVEDIRYMYDIEETINLPLRENARHQIGYQKREYLESLLYNDTNQFEFYQGMIQQKGAHGVFNKLLRNEKLTQARNLKFNEEWAFRKGVYGGANLRSTFEFLLRKDDIITEPQLISRAYGDHPEDLKLLDSTIDNTITLYSGNKGRDSRWIVEPKGKLFEEVKDYTRSENMLPDAGYVRIDEVNYSALNADRLNEELFQSITEITPNERVWLYENHQGTWGVYHVAESSIDGENNITIFESIMDCTVFTLEREHNILDGDYVYIGRDIEVDADLAGMYAAYTGSLEDGTPLESNQFYIKVESNLEDPREYLGDEIGPRVLKLMNVRFSFNDASMTTKDKLVDNSTLHSIEENIVSQIGGIPVGFTIYVDNCYELQHQHKLKKDVRRWGTYSFENGFMVDRMQPAKVFSRSILDVKIFDSSPLRNNSILNAKPLMNGNIINFNPVRGLIPGIADKEISYKLSHDPAYYNHDTNTASGMEFGEEQVGKLWWDLSSVRFLLTETDNLNERELLYRTNNWGRVAPNSSIDIYEWTKSYVSPQVWQDNFEKGRDTSTYDGEVYQSDDPSWVEGEEWNNRLGKFVPVYYFWVKNRKTIPSSNNRRISANSVASMIENPANNGIGWIAPISQESFIVSGLTPYLNDTTTVQVTLTKEEEVSSVHTEWHLARTGDAKSVIPVEVWNKMAVSLSTRNIWGEVVPSKELSPHETVGFDVERGQTIIRNTKQGRKHVIQKLNQFLKKISIPSSTDLSRLLPKDGYNNTLAWVKEDDSDYISIMPSKDLWDTKVNVKSDIIDYGSTLWYSLSGENKFWSVVEPTRWDLSYEGNTSYFDVVDFGGNDEYFHAWDDIAPKQLCHLEVDTFDDLRELEYKISLKEVILYPEQRVKVKDTNKLINGFWTIWELGRNGKFSLLTIQRYDSLDVVNFIDWYAPGYSFDTQPRFVYDTLAERNLAHETDPTIKFVKVNNDGSGKWSWYEMVDGVWVNVARQDGTFQLKEDIAKNIGNYLDEKPSYRSITLDDWDANKIAELKTDIIERDMGYELYQLMHVMREKFLSNQEFNELFFGLVNYIHTEQDYVDWCFKTSFMHITGYTDVLRKDPISFKDVTSQILAYIDETKPYHVKIRDFVSKYGVENERIDTRVTDFSKPLYYDVLKGKLRPLVEENAVDASLLTTGGWKNWWDQLRFDGNSLVRKIRISQKYMEVPKLDISESLLLKVFRKDGPEIDIDYGWDIIDYDGIHSYDFDENCTTVEYAVRYHGLSHYDNTQLDYIDPDTNEPIFLWDAEVSNPRIIARKVNDGTYVNGKVTFTVGEVNNPETDPMITLDYQGSNKQGEWIKTGPATLHDTPI